MTFFDYEKQKAIKFYKNTKQIKFLKLHLPYN